MEAIEVQNLKKLNEPLTIADIEIPELSTGQVLVEMHYSSICGAQLREISGAKGHDNYLPHLLGHEGSGVVSEIGSGVTTVKKGDHVVAHWRKGEGINAGFPKYKWGDNTVGAGNITTFSEYAIISENRLTAIVKDIPLDIACLFGCCVTTGLGIINHESDIKMGEAVVVIGCGGVGLNVIQAASMVSAYPIIAVDINDYKLNIARNMGADFTININKDKDYTNFEQLIYRKNTFQNPTKLVVETTGIIDNINKSYALISTGGKVILVGQPHCDKDLKLKNFASHYCGKTVMDSQGGGTIPQEDIPRYLRLYKAGKLNLEPLITNRFALNDINHAIEEVKKSSAVKCIISMRD